MLNRVQHDEKFVAGVILELDSGSPTRQSNMTYNLG